MKLNLIFTLLCSTMILFTIACSDEEPCTESIWYEDADGDGLGNPDSTVSSCDQPTGYVSDNTEILTMMAVTM